MLISNFFLISGVIILQFGILICDRDNYYATLNVPKDANINKIKKAYRNLAKTLHPDKNKNDPDASEKFKKLTTAYEVLSDKGKRAIYDKGGDPLKSGGQDMFHANDIFSSFFGGFFHQEEGTTQREFKGANVVIDLYATLEEIYNELFVEVVRFKPVYKPTSGTRKCNCRAEMVTKQLGPGRFQMNQVEICDDCPNVKIVNEEKLLEVEIEKGVADRYEYTFFGEGEPHIEGEPGDLIFKIRETKHKFFERRGDDLFCNITISLVNALLGFSMDIEHLDGHKVKVKRDTVTKPGDKMKIPREGMPNYDNNNKFGVLHITFDVVFPPKNHIFNDESEKTAIDKLFGSWHQAPITYNGLQAN
ncbi:unnamed protein product [Gordionus sp. m RMFG-2023]|uniref:dnaJ homolog shv-like n=1 Tax=Gordionus sp. m RMFG-2023 TaxID=3053472 RepID=UPI0030DEA720